MELLIIKTATRYLRVKSTESLIEFLDVGLDKASVFPVDRLSDVRELETQAKRQGFRDIRIKKLVLSEEDL